MESYIQCSPFVHGEAGCGKTILSSNEILFLLDDSESNNTVAHLNFDFQTSEEQFISKLSGFTSSPGFQPKFPNVQDR